MMYCSGCKTRVALVDVSIKHVRENSTPADYPDTIPATVTVPQELWLNT